MLYIVVYICCNVVYMLYTHHCFALQNVRRVSLVTFNSAAHNKPVFIRDLLGDILPHLYNETKVRVRKDKMQYFYINLRLNPDVEL